MEKRNVLVVSTSAGTQDFETTASTWKELQSELRSKGITYEGMKVVVGATKNNLEHPESLLPEEDFELFLMPIKSKSGALNRKEIYAQIKALIGRDGAAHVKAYFSEDGKDYTRMKSERLEELLGTYKAPNEASAPAPQPKAEVKAKVSSTISKKSATGISQEEKDNLIAKVESLKVEFEGYADEDDEEVYAEYDEFVESINNFDSILKLVQALPVAGVQVAAPAQETVVAETEEQRQAREKKEAEAAEAEAKRKRDEERLAKARKLAEGFNDVKSF